MPSAKGALADACSELWVIVEFCDRGTLGVRAHRRTGAWPNDEVAAGCTGARREGLGRGVRLCHDGCLPVCGEKARQLNCCASCLRCTCVAHQVCVPLLQAKRASARGAGTAGSCCGRLGPELPVSRRGRLLGAQAAIERGLLRANAGASTGPPNLPLVLSLAAQIAEGMSFLHSRDVLHGDLCGGARPAPLRAARSGPVAVRAAAPGDTAARRAHVGGGGEGLGTAAGSASWTSLSKRILHAHHVLLPAELHLQSVNAVAWQEAVRIVRGCERNAPVLFRSPRALPDARRGARRQGAAGERDGGGPQRAARQGGRVWHGARDADAVQAPDAHVRHMAPEVLVNNIVTKARRRRNAAALLPRRPAAVGTQRMGLRVPCAGRRPRRLDASAIGVGVGPRGRALW